MSVLEANVPSRDSLEVARLKRRLRPGSRLSASKKAELRERLRQLEQTP